MTEQEQIRQLATRIETLQLMLGQREEQIYHLQRLIQTAQQARPEPEAQETGPDSE